MEALQKDRDEWNEKDLKSWISLIKDYVINKHVKQAITDLEDGMREYYRVFGRKIKPLPPEPLFTDYYHLPESQKRGEIIFIIGGTTLVSVFSVPRYLIINGRAVLQT